MKKIPYTFNKEELIKLFDAIQEPDLMILCFISLFCGLRISETLHLCKNNVDFYKKEIKILNSKAPDKGKVGYGKDRLVPLPEELVIPLQKWFELTKHSQFVFPSIERDDRPVCRNHLLKKYWAVLKRIGLRIPIGQNKIGKPVYKYNFHTFRHTYATMLWEKTGDIYLVRNVLGHSKLETTMVYTHASTKVMKEKVDQAFSKSSNWSILRNVKDAEGIISMPQDSPVEVLKMRVAKGEIGIEEFQKLKQVLI